MDSLHSPKPRRHEVEMYAHALRTRLQLASFKALHGVGNPSFTQLTTLTTTPTPATGTSVVQPLTPSLASNNQPLQPSQPSPSTTPTLSQAESLPSSQSSRSSMRSSRSIYLDIFGTDFRSSPSSSKSLSRTTSIASFSSTSTPSKPSLCNSSAGSTISLLDKTASSPQLGSPERKNGRFDWHNNPTPAMVARETKLAEESFVLPIGSPSKRRREESGGVGVRCGMGKRSRMESGGFLPNGRPASSLAQDLGLSTPRTPKTPSSRQVSGKFVVIQERMEKQERMEEQERVEREERDRVANTLAELAEARNARSVGGGSGSDSSSGSSGSDRPHTPPPTQSAMGLGIGRGSTGFAQPIGKRHGRNVSWGKLPAELHVEETGKEAVGEDRAAADYLLFLASSPSPSSIKSFSGDTETVGTGGILSTPAQTSLWDPFNTDQLNSTGRRSRGQSSLGTLQRDLTSTPLTPPRTTRKLPKPKPEMVGLGFDTNTLCDLTPSTPSKPAANAEEYMLRCTPRSPRTPPPQSRHSTCIDSGFLPTTPPNAPGAPGGDTSFHYADFVNVSPSPQPSSSGRFASVSGYLGINLRTPTKTNRFRFDPRHT